MRLSDIKGDRAIEVIADLIEPITRIAEDEKFKDLMAKEMIDVTAKEVGGKEKSELAVMKGKKGSTILGKIKKNVPYLLKSHTKDLFSVFAILDGVSYEEYYKSVNLAKLVASIIDLLNDPELQSLFTSAEQETDVK